MSSSDSSPYSPTESTIHTETLGDSRRRPNTADSLAVPPVDPKRLVFLGTPEVSADSLSALVRGGFDVALVVTGGPKRRGRGSSLTPSPVHQRAMELGIAVSHKVNDCLGGDADLGVVVAFGRLIRPSILAQLPMINVHFSLLPRWRGAAPVERSIMAGDPETGVCIMGVDVELDSGAIYSRATIPIGVDTTAMSLRSQLSALGAQLLVDSLRSGLANPTDQSGEITYAAKLAPSDFAIRSDSDPIALERASRVAPIWTTFRNRRFRIHRLAVAEGTGPVGSLSNDCLILEHGALRLIEVQIEGKGRQSFTDWCNGARPTADERFDLDSDRTQL